jgi:hypothetical protein
LSKEHHQPQDQGVATGVIPAGIRRLLGEPPLLKGESLEEYNALLEQLALEAKPKDFTSWLLLSEKAAKLWEYRRYQRMARAVVDESVFGAAKEMLGDLSRFKAGRFTAEQVKAGAGSVTVGFQRGNADDAKALRSLLESWGLSVDILYAKAMIACQGDVLMFKKQAERTRNEVRLIERDGERHRFALTQRPKPSKEDAEDIAYEEAA